MHRGTSKTVPFFKLDLSLPKYMGCQSYKPLISTAIKGTFYWKVKLPYLALLRYMRAAVGSAHLSAKSKSNSNKQRLETSLRSHGGSCVSTALHACTLTCDRCTDEAADLLSNCHRA